MSRKVDISGKPGVKGHSLVAGKAFNGVRVGLEEIREDGYYEVGGTAQNRGLNDLKKKAITKDKGCSKVSFSPLTPVCHVPGPHIFW